MTAYIENLVECLREELKQYGEMLALLEVQQEMIVQRKSTDLLENVASIHGHGMAMQAVRCEREQHQRNASRRLGLPEDATFHTLIARAPAVYQPLLQALVSENNDLLRRVQQRARQNHLLLHRALDLMQRFISALAPASGPPVYGESGTLLTSAVGQNPLYDAIG
jgi:flagellar biosynthesis/type III secretory pathway chaperone